ncbi:YrhK family protein [Clavibacter lycopersici]|uniref:YrhK family protein n=1 Tax=Clavibacter lycopersici TaxID=2301718 RepID=UPI001F218714|nr:YrhK family protein [Clavibacter lycopersici]
MADLRAVTPREDPGSSRSVTITIGDEELVIRHKYEVASIVNDVMVAAWFVAGSILFFSESTTTAGTWLFLLGSIQLMIRPLIRLGRRVHLTRIGTGAPGDTGRDY